MDDVNYRGMNIRAPRPIPEIPERAVVRWWGHVQKDRNGGCWTWTGGKTKNGYGQFSIVRSESKYLAHRISYYLFKGPIPKGKILMHTCDNPSCVNPDHLQAGTYKENMVDMYQKGRAPTWLKMKIASGGSRRCSES